MRCKVGEAAYIRRAKHPQNIGKPVEILELLGHFKAGEAGDSLCGPFEADADDFYWLIEGRNLMTVGAGIRHYAVAGDQTLQPIRDPGDDAVDQMVQLLGKPEKAAA